MIKRKEIIIIADVEEGTEKYIQPSIEEGMEFVENEGIIDIVVKDHIDIPLTTRQSDKRFYAASAILAKLVENSIQQNYQTLVKKAYSIADVLLKEE